MYLGSEPGPEAIGINGIGKIYCFEKEKVI